jgi:hypothetical protein
MSVMAVLAGAFLVGTAACTEPPAPEQAAPPADVPVSGTTDPDSPVDGYGNPDFNGIWQALGTAHWNLEAHSASAGPIVEMGALGAIPGGLSVVEGGEIPYRAGARERQQANRADWLNLDPAVKCYLPGVPRATYMPFPFQIVQGPDHILITYEFAGASRIVYMDRPDFEHPIGGTWMGHSRGRFEDGALVIHVDSQVADTWFDSAGNYHSEAMEVVERFTHKGPDVLIYEAEITDPEVFERPWKIRMPLYRRLEENAQLIEFKCIEFAEELMYGHLRKDAETD